MFVDKLTKLDKPSRNAVYGALLVIVGIALYGQIVAPNLRYLKALQRYEPAIDQMIDKQIDIEAVLVDRRAVLEDLKREFDEIGFTVFSPEQLKEFLGSLEQLADQFNCTISKMDVPMDKNLVIIGDVTDPTYVESVSATLTLLGGYQQFITFVDCLQHQARKIWISSLEISTVQQQETILKCNMVLTMYLLRHNASEGEL